MFVCTVLSFLFVWLSWHCSWRGGSNTKILMQSGYGACLLFVRYGLPFPGCWINCPNYAHWIVPLILMSLGISIALEARMKEQAHLKGVWAHMIVLVSMIGYQTWKFRKLKALVADLLGVGQMDLWGVGSIDAWFQNSGYLNGLILHNKYSTGIILITVQLFWKQI